MRQKELKGLLAIPEHLTLGSPCSWVIPASKIEYPRVRRDVQYDTYGNRYGKKVSIDRTTKE